MLAMARDPRLEPTPAQVSAAERHLQRLRDSLPHETWTRLVRCKAMAAAREALRRTAMAAPPATPAPRPAPPKPGAQPRQAALFDFRRAAANDLDDDDER